MSTVTVSPKYQIVIPREVREAMGIRPGQKVEILQYGGQLKIVLVRPARELRGMAKGIDTAVERDEDRV
ncbi:AbrB/MazE/SpoVT family DNA-binding domain-containing protein [bacterium]|nr:AbrB/MazE/SpoVT family DNA-binding domain-containing protein [bacterium]